MVHTSTPDNAPWTAQGDEKRETVKALFSDIAPTYDLCNSLMSFRLHHRWRAYAVSLLQLRPGDCVLDLCSGTGDFVRPLRRAVGGDGVILGADFCEPMLQQAKSRKPSLLVLSDACRIPIRGGSLDAVTVGWGIRNVADVDLALREIARVLKPGGRFASIDMARPRNRLTGAVSEWLFNCGVPILGAMFGKRKAYTYLPRTTASFRTREDLRLSMNNAGFRDVQYRDLFFGNICVHWGVRA